MNNTNWFLNAEATFGGSGTTKMDYDFRCNASNTIVVSTARLATPNTGDSFSTIVSDLQALGFNTSQTDYWVWYDAAIGGFCGQGQIGHDDTETPFGTNPLYSASYTPESDCWFADVAMHEAAHNQGAVQLSAPNSDGTSHCRDGRDVMCNSAGSCSSAQYDCGMTDYFHPNPSAGSYLDTHHNLGGCLNDYVTRDGC